jgi:hypothetical protein
MGPGMTVYTETVVHAAQAYQIAIVEDGDMRVTGRIEGERVVIGDTVVELDARDGVRYFRKA